MVYVFGKNQMMYVIGLRYFINRIELILLTRLM